jgi:hypothetical protein
VKEHGLYPSAKLQKNLFHLGELHHSRGSFRAGAEAALKVAYIRYFNVSAVKHIRSSSRAAAFFYIIAYAKLIFNKDLNFPRDMVK